MRVGEIYHFRVGLCVASLSRPRQTEVPSRTQDLVISKDTTSQLLITNKQLKELARIWLPNSLPAIRPGLRSSSTSSMYDILHKLLRNPETLLIALGLFVRLRWYTLPRRDSSAFPDFGNQSRVHTALTDDTRRIGVLWSGDHLFEGTRETIEMLRSKGE